jgi:hypothetical protein
MNIVAEEHDFDELDRREAPAPLAESEIEDEDGQEAAEEHEADWVD